MSELLPCPFCGDAMELHFDVIRHIDQGACPIGAMAWDDSNVEAWNTRASQAEIERLREALAWVRKNYAGGSTSEINARIDAALSGGAP